MSRDPATELSIRIDADLDRFVPRPPPLPAYDAELDNIVSVLTDACEVVAATGLVRFVVIGFGAEPWNVSVETDLATILPQLPETLARLAEGVDCELCFFEQGVERSLRFLGAGSELRVECVSFHPTWTPEPATMSIDRRRLRTTPCCLSSDSESWRAPWERGGFADESPARCRWP